MGKYSKEKVPELYAAKRALIAYLRKHNIDPSDTKRVKTDPELSRLVLKLNKERDKVMLNYPALDKSNNIKLLKMSKENKKAKAKKEKVKEVKTSKTEKRGRKATKYDYPQVKDEKTGKMRDMTSVEKKKYRTEQRKDSTSSSKKKDTKKDKTPVNKKADKKVEKKSTKKDKRVKKEED